MISVVLHASLTKFFVRGKMLRISGDMVEFTLLRCNLLKRKKGSAEAEGRKQKLLSPPSASPQGNQNKGWRSCWRKCRRKDCIAIDWKQDIFGTILFNIIASQDKCDMSHWVSQLLLVSRIDWCNPGEWWYLLKVVTWWCCGGTTTTSTTLPPPEWCWW